VSVTSYLDAASTRRPLGYGAYLTAYPEGRLASLRMPADRDKPPASRGEINGFSRWSRRRLLELLHTVERGAALPVFVTLTFPDFFPTIEEARTKLDSWLKRIRRKFPEASAVWRLETIDRKSGSNRGQVAPHFHLMVWGVGEGDGAWMSEAWWEVNGKSDYAHLRHGCDAQQIESWRGVASYVGKYMSKDSEHECRGRVWGIHNRARLPVAAPEVRRVDIRTAFRVRRTIRRLMHARGRRGKSKWASSVFTENPRAIWRLADFFTDASERNKNGDT
jgi:hypothetical protein